MNNELVIYQYQSKTKGYTSFYDKRIPRDIAEEFVQGWSAFLVGEDTKPTGLKPFLVGDVVIIDSTFSIRGGQKVQLLSKLDV